MQGITLSLEPGYFLHRQTRGKPKPCLIYAPHHVNDFSGTLWEKVQEVDRADRITQG